MLQLRLRHSLQISNRQDQNGAGLDDGAGFDEAGGEDASTCVLGCSDER